MSVRPEDESNLLPQQLVVKSKFEGEARHAPATNDSVVACEVRDAEYSELRDPRKWCGAGCHE